MLPSPRVGGALSGALAKTIMKASAGVKRAAVARRNHILCESSGV